MMLSMVTGSRGVSVVIAIALLELLTKKYGDSDETLIKLRNLIAKIHYSVYKKIMKMLNPYRIA